MTNRKLFYFLQCLENPWKACCSRYPPRWNALFLPIWICFSDVAYYRYFGQIDSLCKLNLLKPEEVVLRLHKAVWLPLELGRNLLLNFNPALVLHADLILDLNLLALVPLFSLFLLEEKTKPFNWINALIRVFGKASVNDSGSRNNYDSLVTLMQKGWA